VTRLHSYTVTTDRFGDVSFYATDIKDARRDARLRFGIKNPKLVRRTTEYTTCTTCSSAPCCC
jgi:hypothetical protein